ncbi:class I SAM-dependent methyltransferase [Pedobacter mucosus]|uniref:class I SAM-dependent methyltransferase n=1 Tax=Pedobacter mucosus TaxID=2895286 RepID=UPI001EE48863|nr:methyltransferase domain-containing protein [Pedobacter mucosus]UKT63069.1 methyltransferase domain-containing protein [Pedobacter mucosus]
MVNNYDKIAAHYDKLSRLVFFKSQVNAQIDQLKFIPKGSTILLVGGGTGWILEEIAKFIPIGLSIIYVELSAKMIALSKVRNFGRNKVEFVNAGIEEFETDIKFDVILTPFLFDNFSQNRIMLVFNKLDVQLKNNGLWFLVDFSLTGQNGKWWKLILLKSVYLFFRILGIIEAKSLIETDSYFIEERYEKLEEKHYYGTLIKGIIYQKQN